MGKAILYQVYDRVAESIAGPIMAERKPGPAIRHFHGLLATQDTMPGRYPEQFELREIGSQDDETGMIEPHEPTTIATGEAWQQQRAANEDGVNSPQQPYGR